MDKGKTTILTLKVENLSYRYGRGAHHLDKNGRMGSSSTLQNVSFSVERGEIFGLLGPNGCGKTTLFKILSTYFPLYSGSAKILDWEISQEPEKVRKTLGVIFQAPSLDKKLSIYENLVHQGHLYGLSGKPLKDKISDLLERFTLSQRSLERVETLSGGLQRRTEIAKGMIHSPKFLLMDEPSAGLDPGARRELWDYLQKLKKEEVTILMTTHLMDEAERCDRLAILNEGKLVALDSPSSLKSEIGGDVIIIETGDPKTLSEKVQEKFGLKSIILDNSIRIEKENGHKFIPELVQSFSEEISSVTIGKPTLEDFFIRRTGHKF